MIRAITGTEDGVRRLIIDVKEPLQALESMDRLLRTDMISSEDYNYAVLCDAGVSKFFKENDSRKYVLKFRSRDKTEEIWVSGISAGSRVPGAHATLQTLMLMGFEVNPDQDIFNLAKGLEKVFEKKS